MASPTPNQDENLVTAEHPFAGNFHKTLPHNRFGEVIVAAYRRFERTCIEIEAGAPINFEGVPAGPLMPSPPEVPQTAFKISMTDPDAIKALGMAAAKLTSPLAGAAEESFGPDPKTLEMPPAPSIQSISATAEMVELNKLASNVAMGRSMGGVHWRSDNTRSLRLGEEVAIEILRKRSAEYAERPLSFRFRSFDGRSVQIVQGEVLRN
jgi:hypothetical protein